ncbi:hypothetical protein ACF1DW_18320 [Streptomyces sp. NPDC014603]|jgi:hypothetical protein|uniref:hypothetical protein n=1 Tax=unclassified Streptomyces TaxID=2593676 RepID=UPI00369778BA
MSFERKSGRPTADAQARRAEGDMRFGPLPAAFGEDAPGTATGPGGFSTRAAGHPVDDRPHHPDDDRRLLRVILAVPVVLLTLVAAFFLWLALNTRPDDAGDEAAYGGIELGSALTVVFAGAVGALWLAPSVRRVMRWPWAAPAVALGAAAVARWVSSGA